MRNKKTPKNKEMPKFHTLDIEAFIKTMGFRLMAVFTKDKKGNEIIYEYHDIHEFFKEFLTQSRYYKIKSFTFYAHFGGGYDFYFLLDSVFDKYQVSDFSAIVSGANIMSMSFTLKGIRFVFNDSYCLFRTSLKKVIAALCKTKKLLDLNTINLDKFGDRRVMEYCIDDCRQLYNSLVNYQNLLDFPLSLTAASLSLNIFKTEKFMCKQWPKIGLTYEKDIRKWQHAGRVDVFKRYGKNVSFFDINNFYPAIMYEFGAPVGLPRIVTKRDKSTNIAGFYLIKLINAPYMSIPFLPVKLNHKLFFLDSTELDYYITTAEIELLDKYGYKYKIIRGYEFQLDRDFFKEYVGYWCDKMKESPDYKFLAKNMLNHLSGKFSQKLTFDRISQKEEMTKDDKLEGAKWLSHEFKIMSKPNDHITDFMNPQISCWIWSHARKKLWNYLVINENNGLCYCDTDSVVCDTDTFDKSLIDKNEIGMFKIERSCKEAIFLAPKLYGYINEKDEFKYKIKGFDAGFKDKTITNVTYDIFQQKLKGIDVDFELETTRLAKIKTVIKKSQWLLFYTHTKRIRQANIKRQLDSDGITTRPFIYKNGGVYDTTQEKSNTENSIRKEVIRK